MDSIPLNSVESTPKKSGAVRRGEPFNPYRGICGFYPPDIVGRQHDLTDGQKRLYERLVRRAGKNGACFPSLELLAFDLGKSDRQVKRDLSALERRGLVGHVRHGRRLANSYQFLWHQIFEGDGTSTSYHPNGDGTDSRGDGTSTSLGDGTPASYEFSHENYVQGKPSSSAAVTGEPAAVIPIRAAEGVEDDDRSPSKESENQPQNAVAECLRSTVKEWGLPPLKGKMPVSEVAEILEHVGATVEDLAHFLRNVYRGKRGANPVAWAHVLTSVKHWSVDPKLARAIATRRMFAEGEERAREREQRMAEAEAERERIEAIAVPPDEAIAAAAEEVRKAPHTFRGYLFDVPEPIKRRLRRVGALVSPADVLQMVREYRLCKDCGDSGLIGSALERTRTFCGCIAGEELRHEEPDRPAREIEHAHASLKNKLVATAHANHWPFLADALENSTVSDDGAAVVVDADPRWRLALVMRGSIPSEDLLRCVELVTGARVRLAWADPQQPEVPEVVPRFAPITASDFAPFLAARASA